MAITNTRTVERVEVVPATPSTDDPVVNVFYRNTFDDPDDNRLPTSTTSIVSLMSTTTMVDEEGTPTTSPTDISGEDQMVQDICGAIWTD